MKYRRNLMTGLIGFALLATPISAAARDNDSDRNYPNQSQPHHEVTMSRSDSGPARTNAPAARTEIREQHEARIETRSVAPNATANQYREHHEVRSFNRAPVVVSRPVVVAPPVVVARPDVRRDRDRDRDDDDRWEHRPNYTYRRYDRRYYVPCAAGAPYYVMPRGYAGGACAWARHLRAIYQHDRATGHPAAANDLLSQLHRAERDCGGVPYGYYNRYR